MSFQHRGRRHSDIIWLIKGNDTCHERNSKVLKRSFVAMPVSKTHRTKSLAFVSFFRLSLFPAVSLVRNCFFSRTTVRYFGNIRKAGPQLKAWLRAWCVMFKYSSSRNARLLVSPLRSHIRAQWVSCVYMQIGRLWFDYHVAYVFLFVATINDDKITLNVATYFLARILIVSLSFPVRRCIKVNRNVTGHLVNGQVPGHSIKSIVWKTEPYGQVT